MLLVPDDIQYTDLTSFEAPTGHLFKQAIKQVTLQREGLSDPFAKTKILIREGIDSGVATAIVFGVWSGRDPNQIWAYGTGKTSDDALAGDVTPATVFDLASLTKVVSTATLVGRLIDRGWMSLEMSLASVFPKKEFEGILLRHLLSHTGGLIWWEPFWERILKRFPDQELWKISPEFRKSFMKEMILNVSPQVAPGVRVEYSDVSAMLVGFMIEEIMQMPLDLAARKWIYDPLEMHATGYRKTQITPTDRDPSVAATEICSWRGSVLQGQVHDDNCWAMGGVSGHAGVFGTVPDLLLWIRGLCQGFVSETTLNSLWERVKAPIDATRTVGFDIGISSVGRHFSPDTVGHTGFTGTSIWFDRRRELAVALLTNRVHPTRENIKIREFRPKFHNALMEDLMRFFPHLFQR